MNEFDISSIVAAAAELKLALSEEQAGSLAIHLRMLQDANARFNLTAVPPDEYVVTHLLDSLSAAHVLSSAPVGPFADVGSGAGFPGVPLAIQSGRHVDLVESVKKKARYLDEVVRAIRLDATVRDIRAEELVAEHAEAYSAVVFRAVSPLPSLVELASPLLSEGGLAICMKGDLSAEERSRGATVAAMVGMEVLGVEQTAVPGLEAARCIVSYRKRGKSAVRLPRRCGMAQRQPLA